MTDDKLYNQLRVLVEQLAGFDTDEVSHAEKSANMAGWVAGSRLFNGEEPTEEEKAEAKRCGKKRLFLSRAISIINIAKIMQEESNDR